MIGQTIGNYEILELLGEGGMGSVYLASDSRLQRTVAVKVIRPDHLGDSEAQQRLWREARTAAGLEHPFICKVFEVVDSEAGICIVMEHLTGETLDEWVARRRPSVNEILRVGGEVAEALAAAHDAGIMHRDIKPTNVLMTPSGHPKVMDFGLAKPILGEGGAGAVDAGAVDAGADGSARNTEARVETQLTRAGAFLGTPGYVAPETLRGRGTTFRSDLFSLGCLLYHLATQTDPFGADTTADTFARTLSAEPRPPASYNGELPQAFDTLIAGLLEKDPERRMSSAADVAVQLRKMRDRSGAGQTIGAEQMAGAGQTTAAAVTAPRRRRILLAVSMVAAAVLLVIVIFQVGQRFGPAPASSYELAILPLVDSATGTPQQAPARELRRQLELLGGPTRVLPFSELEEIYGSDVAASGVAGADRLLGYASSEARFTLRWEVIRFGDTPVLSVDIASGDGSDVQQRLEYPLPEQDSLASLLAGRLPREVEAFLFSWRESDAVFPSGYEQVRPHPITWSDEAARAYLEALSLTYEGEHWQALALINHALEIDDEFAQAYSHYSYLIMSAQVPYTGPVLSLPAIQRALELRNRLEPWEVEILERAQQFLQHGPGPAIPPMDEAMISELGEYRQSWLWASILLFQNRRQELLDYSLERLQEFDGPNVLWIQGPPSVLDLAYPPEQIATLLEPLLQAHPDDPWSHLTMGLCLSEHPEATKRAEAEFARARELAGGRWEPSLAWVAGKMEYYAGRYGKAEEILLEALQQQRPPGRFSPDSRLAEMSDPSEETGDPRLFAFLALTYRAMGRLDEAWQQIELYRRVLPASPWGDYEAGRIMIELAEPEAAIAELTQSIQKDPAYQYAYYMRAQALRSVGRAQEALADLEQFVQLMGPLRANVPSVQEARRAIEEIRSSLGLG